MWKRTRVITGFFCAMVALPTLGFAGNAVSEWNQVAVTLTLGAIPAQAPVQQCRTMAIVQVSVHDAVNAITGEYDTYGATGPVPPGASAEAAAIAAAYHALKALFPAQAASLEATYLLSLDTNHVSSGDPGLDFGRNVAESIVAMRANDRASEAQFDYTVPGAGTLGVWERLNNAPALLPGWGRVTPWVLRSGSQFRPDGPPSLTSDQYAKDLNEVQEIGSATSTLRTAEQSAIAIFWRASPTAIWNRVLTQVLGARSLTLSETARVYALMYLAASDVSVACWDAKYAYNFWRPQRAIANADIDGNPATVGDPAWRPLLPTPPHPEYPSGHTCNSAAMATVLETVLGADPGVTISLTFAGVTRNWQTFDQGVEEVIDARVYSGIHYRSSDETGARLGRHVARFVLTHALRRPTGTFKQ